MFGKTFELARDLYCKLPGWNKYQSLDCTGVRLDPLQHWQRIGQGLAGPGLGLANKVAAFQERSYGFFLYRECLAESHVPDTLEKTRVQTECFETLNQVPQRSNLLVLLTLGPNPHEKNTRYLSTGFSSEFPHSNQDPR